MLIPKPNHTHTPLHHYLCDGVVCTLLILVLTLIGGHIVFIWLQAENGKFDYLFFISRAEGCSYDDNERVLLLSHVWSLLIILLASYLYLYIHQHIFYKRSNNSHKIIRSWIFAEPLSNPSKKGIKKNEKLEAMFGSNRASMIVYESLIEPSPKSGYGFL